MENHVLTPKKESVNATFNLVYGFLRLCVALKLEGRGEMLFSGLMGTGICFPFKGGLFVSV